MRRPSARAVPRLHRARGPDGGWCAARGAADNLLNPSPFLEHVERLFPLNERRSGVRLDHERARERTGRAAVELKAAGCGGRYAALGSLPPGCGPRQTARGAATSNASGTRGKSTANSPPSALTSPPVRSSFRRTRAGGRGLKNSRWTVASAAAFSMRCSRVCRRVQAQGRRCDLPPARRWSGKSAS